MGARVNPRKGSYGYTFRVNLGVSAAQFNNISMIVSASANDGFNFYLSASTLFVGNSTVHSSTEGITFNSGEWVWAKSQTAEPFATADDYKVHVVAKATGEQFITPQVTITVDA